MIATKYEYAFNFEIFDLTVVFEMYSKCKMMSWLIANLHVKQSYKTTWEWS